MVNFVFKKGFYRKINCFLICIIKIEKRNVFQNYKERALTFYVID